ALASPRLTNEGRSGERTLAQARVDFGGRLLFEPARFSGAGRNGCATPTCQTSSSAWIASRTECPHWRASPSSSARTQNEAARLRSSSPTSTSNSSTPSAFVELELGEVPRHLGGERDAANGGSCLRRRVLAQPRVPQRPAPRCRGAICSAE